ncbi:MAG TPA: lipocalin-like domain-containing protein [Woeseiaceae bacterium]|nr:lipocalin-like domain-containing protein [Woeseiaceae bacterium]
MLLAIPCADAEPASSPSELARALGAGDDAGFAKALEPREFVFPDDHGPHPEFRNEWWYVTGNLDSENGRRFGYELTIFRVALAPDAPASPSDWRTNMLYFAHFAVTDAAAAEFHAAERYARGAAGLAGAAADPFRVWLYDWRIEALPSGAWRLAANDADVRLEVTLDAMKPPVLNGKAGLSQKSAEPGNASYYYSVTRFDTNGRLALGGDTFTVAGTSWLDREWSTSALAPDQAGWDWFALQLDDGSDLMVYALRRRDGTIDAESAGTFTAADGSATQFARDEIRIDVTDRWTSPRGGTYPAGWRLAVPSLGLALEVEPVVADQELDTLVRYWEGAVDVSGTRGGSPVAGRGYVELTGYAKPRELERP